MQNVYNVVIMNSPLIQQVKFKKRDRRRNEDGSRKVQIKELWSLSQEILRLTSLGMKQVQIAKYLGCTPQTVSNTVNSDLGKEKLKLMAGARDADTLDIAEWIKKATVKSLKVYDEILDEEEGAISWSLKKNTADTIVKDLAGLEAPKKIITGHFTLEEIEAIKQRGKELAKSNGSIVDVTPS